MGAWQRGQSPTEGATLPGAAEAGGGLTADGGGVAGAGGTGAAVAGAWFVGGGVTLANPEHVLLDEIRRSYGGPVVIGRDLDIF